jgi:hypothetical protein
MTINHLEISTLESWLWEAACKIRGPVDAPKYKDYILPLIFLKRLSNVFADEVQGLAEEYLNVDMAQSLVEADHSLVRFYVPPKARWTYIAQLTPSGLGEALTDAVRAVPRENPRLAGVIDVTDFNATTAGQRIVGDEHLHELVLVLNQHRLVLDDVEPDILGRAYEYLLRKFAESQGQSAGEFYTPRMVGVLNLGLRCGVIGELTLWLMMFMLIFGIFLGLSYGGEAFIRHFCLRFILYRNGSITWNYARFLDYATERIFLRKVGGGYIFIHRMLMEYFASLDYDNNNMS